MKTEIIWIGILEVLLLSYFKILKKTTRAGMYSICAFAFFFSLLEGEFETGTPSLTLSQQVVRGSHIIRILGADREMWALLM